MAPKTKKRSLAAIQETTRQRLKLRSPSLIKPAEGYSPEPIAKRGKQANPKPAAACLPLTATQSPPPNIPPEVRPTERLKAIIRGMEEDRKVKLVKRSHPSPKKQGAERPISTPKKHVNPQPCQVRKSPRRMVNAAASMSAAPQFPVIPSVSNLVQPPAQILPVLVQPPAQTLPVSAQPPARSPTSNLSDIPSELIPSISNSVQPTQSTSSGSLSQAGQATNSQPMHANESAFFVVSTEQLPPFEHPEPPEFEDDTPTVDNVVFECPEGDIPVVENPRSIRCKAKANTGDQPARKTRGVVNGQKVANYVRALGTKIKVEHGPEHNGPRSRQLRSMLTHEIGSCVRDKVPLLAPSYCELETEHWAIVFDHLTPNFVLDFDDTWIWSFITRIAIERYRDWKSDCKVHYEKYGAELPLEFVDRKEQWRWLVGHCREPKVQARGQKMKEVRNAVGRINHHSGKIPFSHRAEKHALSNDKAPYIAAYGEVYGADARGAEIAEKMRQRVREMMSDQESDDPGAIDDPLPVSTQIEIISQLVGQKRGTRISGIGKSLAREPLPRGGARIASDTIQLTEELRKTQEDMAKKFEERMADQANKFMEHIRLLEEMIKGGSGAMASNASDGATSLLPARNG